jgi:WD40 repeat protein
MQTRTLSLALAPLIAIATARATSAQTDVGEIYNAGGKATWIVNAVSTDDGRLVALFDSSGTIAVWDTRDGRQLARWLTGLHGPFNWSAVASSPPAAFSPNGRYLAVGGNDGRVRVFDPTFGRLLLNRAQSASGHPVIGPTGKPVPFMNSFPITTVAWNKRGDVLATASSLGSITFRYPNRGWREESVWPVADVTSIQAIAWSPAADYLAVSLSSRVLILPLRRSASSRTLIADASVQLDENSSGTGNVAFSPDGRILAASINPGVIRLYSVGTRERLGLLRSDHKYYKGASPLRFSPDGRLLAGGSLERIYVFSTLEQRVLEAHEFVPRGRVANFWFTGDGRHIIAAGVADSVLRVRAVHVSR